MSIETNKPEVAQMVLSDPRWHALTKRDHAADGTFLYSVKTTGVYCRPSCAARLPRPEHIQFHATRADAEKAGFRPCKRCKPDQAPLAERNAAKIAKACRMIEDAQEPPALAHLAAAAGVSPFHFHRLFKAVTGLTPNHYATAHRNQRVRSELGRSPSVTNAIYDAGYNANSRFYETSNAVLGMTPSNFRAGGLNVDISFAIGQCSLGAILAAQSQRGVCAILIGDDPEQLVRDLQDQFPKANLLGGVGSYENVISKVVALVEKPAAGFDLPLDIRGTIFQQRVWNALRQIPVGATATYTEIAEKIGDSKASRAVAQACAANSLAVAIPCHRVIRSDGTLSGYRWGVERKRMLLQREARA